MLYKQKPIRGILSNDNRGMIDEPKYLKQYSFFIPVNEKGKPLISKAVSIYARHYADTESEAIDGYNHLIDNLIKTYQEKISELKSEFI